MVKLKQDAQGIESGANAEFMNENYLTVGKTIDTAILYKDSVDVIKTILAEKGIASYLKIHEYMVRRN